ncbi:MAG: thioredoxin domain-containing protein [Sideroxydans sp.]|nr:thioredoxin domain-containing protein [Sideroxydans sp.]
MKLIKRIFLVLAMLCATQAMAEPQLGKEYKLLNPPQPTHSGNKVEVLEFFFYGCIHCFYLHPGLSAWEKKMPGDVQLTYVPTIFRDSWEPMANTYYALELMGERKRLDDALFKAWNVDNVDLSDESRIAAFLSQHGVDSKKFGELYNSFTVETKVLRSKQMVQSYRIMGTPTLIVDGKYVIEGLEPDETIRVLDAVVERARKEHSRK